MKQYHRQLRELANKLSLLDNIEAEMDEIETNAQDLLSAIETLRATIQDFKQEE